MPPTRAPGAGTSHCCHCGLQRWAWAIATAKQPVSRHQVLPQLSRECASHLHHWEPCKQAPITFPAAPGRRHCWETQQWVPSTAPAVLGVQGQLLTLGDPGAGASCCPCCSMGAWAAATVRGPTSRLQALAPAVLGTHSPLPLLGVPQVGTNCAPPYRECTQATAPKHPISRGNGQHTLRKEAASIQTKSTP